jgi:hypothetical protein
MNCIINEMDTLINCNGEWIVEPGENVVIQQFCSKSGCIFVQGFRFHPFSGIINSN